MSIRHRQECRAKEGGSECYSECYFLVGEWYYHYDELKDGYPRRLGKKWLALIERTGNVELFLSNHRAVLPVGTIIGD